MLNNSFILPYILPYVLAFFFFFQISWLLMLYPILLVHGVYFYSRLTPFSREFLFLAFRVWWFSCSNKILLCSICLDSTVIPGKCIKPLFWCLTFLADWWTWAYLYLVLFIFRLFSNVLLKLAHIFIVWVKLCSLFLYFCGNIIMWLWYYHFDMILWFCYLGFLVQLCCTYWSISNSWNKFKCYWFSIIYFWYLKIAMTFQIFRFFLGCLFEKFFPIKELSSTLLSSVNSLCFAIMFQNLSLWWGGSSKFCLAGEAKKLLVVSCKITRLQISTHWINLQGHQYYMYARLVFPLPLLWSQCFAYA